ncbi:hypothetical protein A0H81_00669 [Grifola frondosa]|uniref:Alginate lyase domain-containing protein n=1 Tax=Grifola frondosa TaxID=5627 RepID=A0A1C7MPI3_GRIFR|nr:hypothetical protein A0H81_00669 [Grifola frondosa]
MISSVSAPLPLSACVWCYYRDPVSLTAVTGVVSADSNDWVAVDYVLLQSGSGASSDTANARQSIISKAGSSAKSGPWSIVTKGGIAPPSKDTHDYLSWAPYHWPDCNWCSKGTNHLSGPDSGGDGTPDGSYENGGLDGPDSDGDGNAETLFEFPFVKRGGSPFSAHRMIRRNHAERARASPLPVDISERSSSDNDGSEPPNHAVVLDILPLPADGDTPSLPAQPPPVDAPPAIPSGSQTTTRTVAGTPAPAQAPAKTQNGDRSSCTPSPTKSMAPSATWTQCPYKVQDGKVNPDHSPSRRPRSILRTLLTSSTPSAWAGRGTPMGTFTGILDLRGIVKVVNSILLLKASGSPDWTSSRDKAMTAWMGKYISWLQVSVIGKETASKANNHLSFYVSQLAAAKMFVGDKDGAADTLKGYFASQYLDQIAASGEQPFEAVRTRPYHYRCFNLEAMITNAKLGDQLGFNFWSAKSKYGATIQTAVDYAMAQDPKGEDVSDIFPHVAAVAAAYGDPKGKYKTFLQQKCIGYQSQPFYFYDQTVALPNSPAAHSGHSRRDDIVDSLLRVDTFGAENMLSTMTSAANLTIPFECPAVFDDAPQVEIEDDLFVTCDELKPFYGILSTYGAP